MPRTSDASLPATLDTQLGISALRFNYKEMNTAGALLDKEQGGIPGVSFNLALRHAEWEWEGAASYHRGLAPYTGQTQDGIPYNTKTDERIVDVSMRFGAWLDSERTLMPFAGVGYRRWDRHLLAGSAGTTQVNSLFETYGWSYAWIGSRFKSGRCTRSCTRFDLGLIRPLRPELHAGADATAYYLKGKTGLRMMLSSAVELSARTRLVIEPYYEHWQLGRSTTVTTSSGSWYEPDSNARNLGLNLRLARTF